MSDAALLEAVRKLLTITTLIQEASRAAESVSRIIAARQARGTDFTAEELEQMERDADLDRAARDAAIARRKQLEEGGET